MTDKIKISDKLVSLSNLSKEEFDEEIQKGFDDIISGRVISAKDMRQAMKKRYGL